MIAEGRYDDVLDTIIEKYKALEEKCDFVLCIGSDFEDGGRPWNSTTTPTSPATWAALSCIVTSGAGRDVDEICQ